MDAAKELKKRLGTALLENEPLSKHTTYKIGGPAKFFVQGKTAEIIKEAFAAAIDLKLPYFVLGSGSNILVSDKGFDGLVIRLANVDIKIEGEKVFCGAGVANAILVKETVDEGLTGAEWAICVPGSVGGSIRGNAGAYSPDIPGNKFKIPGGDFSRIIEGVESFDGRKVKKYDNAGLKFHYRDSIFKHEADKEIVLSAVLNLKKSTKALAKENMIAFLNKKNGDHPMGLPSAGCVFKNVELLPGSYELKDPSLGRPSDFFKSEVPQEFIDRGNVPAGFLIEALDLKGKTVGGIQVSNKHANYLVNLGNGKAEEVIILISLIKQQVRTQFGVQLKEEIQLVGF